MAAYVSPDVPSNQASALQRSPRYLFIAKFRVTDAISGMQAEGLTTDLSEGGCCLLMRRGLFSAGTPILLEITKNGAVLSTNATVIYNLRDQIIGVCFAEMSREQTAIVTGWIKTATPAPDSRKGTI
jgi:PilZ domain